MKNKKFIIIIILLVMSSVASWRLYFKIYRQADTVNIHKFPKELNGWVSRDLTITEREYELLETRNVFAREYTSESGSTVFFFAVYSENNRKVSHPPEICYAGGGVTVIDSIDEYVTFDDRNMVLKSNRILLQQGSLEQVAYYWFKVGDTFTSSYWKQQVFIALRTLFARPSSSALIRVSATVKDGDYAKTDVEIKKFIEQIIDPLQIYLP